ncbi:hypothetical protein LR69_01483 [Geobacillus sp. BCO2]|nr:hypothetical protein LR69_01483 [Geobacillus sp. BCO2]
MSLASYIIRTMFIVIPGTAVIGVAVCSFNDIHGAAFWWTIAATILFGALVGFVSATLNYRRFVARLPLLTNI